MIFARYLAIMCCWWSVIVQANYNLYIVKHSLHSNIIIHRRRNSGAESEKGVLLICKHLIIVRRRDMRNEHLLYLLLFVGSSCGICTGPSAPFHATHYRACRSESGHAILTTHKIPRTDSCTALQTWRLLSIFLLQSAGGTFPQSASTRLHVSIINCWTCIIHNLALAGVCLRIIAGCA